MLNEEIFQSGAGVISTTAKATRSIQGVNLTVIDSVGFSDDSKSLESNLGQIIQAMHACTDGINAVIFVVKANDHYTTSISDVLTEMYQISDLWDCCFVVFTNAKELGNTDAEQANKILEQLSDEGCPKNFKALLQRVQQRYAVVESKHDMGENYISTKMGQILQMVNKIKKCIPGPYTSYSFQLAFTKYKETKEEERIKEMHCQEQQRSLEEQQEQLEQQQQQKQQLEEEKLEQTRLEELQMQQLEEEECKKQEQEEKLIQKKEEQLKQQREEEEQMQLEEEQHTLGDEQQELQTKVEEERGKAAELQQQREEEEIRMRRKRSSGGCVIS